jgi:hypothetical protein
MGRDTPLSADQDVFVEAIHDLASKPGRPPTAQEMEQQGT